MVGQFISSCCLHIYLYTLLYQIKYRSPLEIELEILISNYHFSTYILSFLSGAWKMSMFFKSSIISDWIAAMLTINESRIEVFLIVSFDYVLPFIACIQ